MRRRLAPGTPDGVTAARMTAAVPDVAASAPIDRGAALLGFAVVVLANLRYLAGLPALLDPLVSMEPFYIRMAQQPVADILREPPAWGPLYALWLKPFVAALGEPLAVQAAGAWALSLAVTSVVYLHLLQHTRRAALATGGALFVLIADGNVPLAGKTSSFALLVLLGGWDWPGWRRAARAAARRWPWRPCWHRTPDPSSSPPPSGSPCCRCGGRGANRGPRSPRRSR